MAKSKAATELKPKSKAGRPKKDIDYKTLENLCKIQATGEECAAVLGMNYDTLSRNLKLDGYENFTDYIKKHSAVGRASLRRIQWKQAESGSTAMAIFLGKNYLEQSDKLEHTGANKGPITFKVVYDE